VFFSDYNIVRAPVGVGVPICSLAGIFGMIPGDWLANRFPASGGGGIGLVWSGSPTHSNNHFRSCPVQYFKEFASLGRCYSLNPAATVPSWCSAGGDTWSTTIELVRSLDYVVSVDTSIVHLCGAMNVPCLMIQPLYDTDFRWGLGYDSTPWYSSVNIISNNGWETAVKKVIECIKR
jgi:hypothetical protein